jgi:hypothetical protein
MTSATPQRRLVGAAGVAAVLFFLLLIARFWHPVYGFTSLIQLDGASDDRKIAAFRERPIFVYPGSAGYDGIYYAELAYDPTLRNPEFATALDSFSYRARRILPSALAWLLAAGQPDLIVHVYSLLNVAAWLVLAALLWRLLDVSDGRGLLAWLGVMFSAGTLASVRLSLTDLVALAIVAGAMLAVERGKNSLAAAVLAAAALARETSLAAFAGLAQRPWFSRQNFLRALAVAAPLAAWIAYVRFRAGHADAGWGNFTLPVVGLVEKWGESLRALRTVADKPLAWTSLLATLALTVQAAFMLTRWRPDDRWWRLGAVFAGVMLCLGTAVWEGFPGAAARALLPLTLAFNLVVHRTRAPLAWLLAGNLAVFSGLLALRDVPYNWLELAAVKSRGVAASAQLGSGWYGVERAGRLHWAWSDGSGQLAVESWPKRAHSLRLEFSIRSLKPRTVTIRQDGRELARLEVGEKLAPHAVPIVIGADGRAALEFSTDTPGVPESADAGARSLAFALYEPRLVVTDQ